jgi:hypothetical protein
MKAVVAGPTRRSSALLATTVFAYNSPFPAITIIQRTSHNIVIRHRKR